MTIFVDSDTLTTMYTLSTTSSDDADDTIGSIALSATSISTTLSLSSPQYVYAEETNKYVASLSDEELEEFESLLAEKEEELNIGEQQKVLIKSKNA